MSTARTLATAAALVLLSADHPDRTVLFGALTKVPAEAPEWITLFPKIGAVETRDGRSYRIEDAEALIADFRSYGIDLPIDINHATDIVGAQGQDAPAYGWINDMRIKDGALQARVEWLDEGKALIAAKKYRYISPTFWPRGDVVARMKGAALVTSPALGGQPALASVQTTSQEIPMKSVLAALGLADGASEAQCLSAVTDLKGKLDTSVPKALHDEAVAKLAAATTELDQIKKTARDEKVAALVAKALTDKKILPAQKDHYVALCATDAGLVEVEKLLAASGSMLPGSGLDTKTAPQGGGLATATQLAAKAAEKVAKGEAATIADAMTMLQAEAASA